MTRHRLSILLLGLLLSAALVAGCDSGDDDSGGGSGQSGNGGTGDQQPKRATGRPKGKPPKVQTGFPEGAPAYVGGYVRDAPEGSALRKLGTGGRLSLFVGRKVYSVSGSRNSLGGSLKVSGTRAVLGAQRLPRSLPKAVREQVKRGPTQACPSKAVYRFTVSSKSIKLSPVRDRCALRRAAVAGSWTRTK